MDQLKAVAISAAAFTAGKILLSMCPCIMYDGRAQPAEYIRLLKFIAKQYLTCTERISIAGTNYPAGIVIGRGFAAKIDYGRVSFWTLGPKPDDEPKIPSHIDVYDSMDGYWYMTRNALHVERCACGQSAIVNAIVSKPRFTAVISGPPGAGKTYVGYLVANHLSIPVISTWNPFVSSSRLIPNSITPPIVVLLNEINSHLREAVILPEKRVIASDLSKASVCNWLDYMHTLKGVYLIVTMNEDPSVIDALDPAILRPGRIDQRFTLPSDMESVD